MSRSASYTEVSEETVLTCLVITSHNIVCDGSRPSPNLANIVFELPAHRLEGVKDGYVGVCVGMVFPRFPIDHEFPMWHHDANPHLVDISVTMMPVRFFDDHVTAYDKFEEFFELVGMLVDTLLQCLREIHPVEADLKG